MAYRIITFDGGGIRGVFSARLLANLCEDAGAMEESVDLLSGSSVGATNALALALGMKPSQMVGVYENHAATIFPPKRRKGWFKSIYSSDTQRIGHLAALTEAGIEEPDRRTLATLQRHVLITTFMLNGNSLPSAKGKPAWKGKLFHNFALDNNGNPNPDLSELVIDVLLRSSAAPIMFPVYQGFADGGLVAINPSVCALAQALNPATGGATLPEVRLLSFGTGSGATYSLDVETASWGVMQWGIQAGKYADRFIDAFADVPAFQTKQFLGERFLRLNPPIPPDSSCDWPSDIPRLVKAADDMRQTPEWAKAVEWVKTVWLAD